MTEKQIIDKFNEVVQDKEAMKRLEATKYQIYNWRNPDRAKTSVGAMLEVLWKLGHLDFSK